MAKAQRFTMGAKVVSQEFRKQLRDIGCKKNKGSRLKHFKYF